MRGLGSVARMETGIRLVAGPGVPAEEALDVAAALIDAASAGGASLAVTVVRADADDQPEPAETRPER